jgi:ribosomal protein S18 acetylase RimI-like enzyme
MTAPDRGRARLILASLVATFVVVRVALGLSPDSDFDVAGHNVHHLFTGLLLIVAGGVPLAISPARSRWMAAACVAFGCGLALALDEWVYLIVTDGSNASYLLPVSFRGGVVMVGLAVVYVLWLARGARRDEQAMEARLRRHAPQPGDGRDVTPFEERFELGGQTILVRRLETAAEAEACARMMAGSEPWITLGRDFAASLARVRDPGRETYVALCGGELAGFLILSMQGAFTGYVQTIAVAAAGRGRGLGARLMAFAERRIFAETPNVFLCVSSFNPRARAFYERLGYAHVGELTDYIVKGHAELLMRKTAGPLRDGRAGA